MNKIFLILIIIFLYSCADIENPAKVAQIKLIPKNLAINYLQKKKQTNWGGECSFKQNYYTKGNSKYYYSNLYYNTYKLMGELTIDVKVSGEDFICYYSFTNEKDFNKFASALASIGIKYDPGAY